MIAGEGYWEFFDFILADLDTPAFELTTQFCQAWPLLKPGGLMAFARFDDSTSELPTSLTALLKSLGNRITILLSGETLLVMKHF